MLLESNLLLETARAATKNAKRLRVHDLKKDRLREKIIEKMTAVDIIIYKYKTDIIKERK